MKNKSFGIIVFALVGTLATPVAFAEDSFWSWLFSVSRKKEVAPVSDEQYQEECGECHFPYQPGFLPEASWKKLLDAKALQDHFGDNAELDEDVRKHIEEFVVDNSADKSWYKRSRKVMASLDSDSVPLRITEVPYIKDKHSEIPQAKIKQDKVKSLSQCNKCHTKAGKAIYDDDTVSIP
jgi:hypothetical protein